MKGKLSVIVLEYKKSSKRSIFHAWASLLDGFSWDEFSVILDLQ